MTLFPTGPQCQCEMSERHKLSLVRFPGDGLAPPPPIPVRPEEWLSLLCPYLYGRAQDHVMAVIFQVATREETQFGNMAVI